MGIGPNNKEKSVCIADKKFMKDTCFVVNNFSQNDDDDVVNTGLKEIIKNWVHVSRYSPECLTLDLCLESGIVFSRFGPRGGYREASSFGEKFKSKIEISLK